MKNIFDKYLYQDEPEEEIVVETEPEQPAEDDPLTELQRQCYDLNQSGLTQLEIANELGLTQPTVNQALKRCVKKGFTIIRHQPKLGRRKKSVY